MNLTREELLEIYNRRYPRKGRISNNPLSWPSCDRPLTPAETAYLVPEFPEEEQSTLTPP